MTIDDKKRNRSTINVAKSQHQIKVITFNEFKFFWLPIDEANVFSSYVIISQMVLVVQKNSLKNKMPLVKQHFKPIKYSPKIMIFTVKFKKCCNTK